MGHARSTGLVRTVFFFFSVVTYVLLMHTPVREVKECWSYSFSPSWVYLRSATLELFGVSLYYPSVSLQRVN